VGEAIEALAVTGADEATIHALAHHFAEAALDGQVAKAADYGLAAARRAMDGLAFEAAVSACERALAVLALEPDTDLVRRAATTLLLAEALQAVGDVEASQAAAEAAARDARTLGDATTLARAAILHVELTVVGSPDPVGAALCVEALAALPIETDPLRVRVAAALAFHRAWSESRGAAVADAAGDVVRMARASGDDDALADALHAHAVSLAASTRIDEQLAVVDELLAIGAHRGFGHRRAQALQVRASTRLRLGDIDGFDADASELERLGQEQRSWNALAYAAQWRTTRALLDGRFAEVPELAAHVLVHGSRYIDYQSVYTSQLFILAMEMGEVAGLRELLLDAQARTPGVVAFTTALALVHAELGETAEAMALLDEMAPDDFARVPRDVAWFGSMHGLCEAAAAVEAADHARVLYELLLPEAGRFVVIALGIACTGSADRYLGMLSLATGDLDRAVGHLEAAMSSEKRLGSAPLLARSQLWAARALERRGAAGDVARAATLRATAQATAARLGMAGLLNALRR
jgi:tetratricopeptide (TPR) repeat protein